MTGGRGGADGIGDDIKGRDIEGGDIEGGDIEGGGIEGAGIESGRIESGRIESDRIESEGIEMAGFDASEIGGVGGGRGIVAAGDASKPPAGRSEAMPVMQSASGSPFRRPAGEAGPSLDGAAQAIASGLRNQPVLPCEHGSVSHSAGKQALLASEGFPPTETGLEGLSSVSRPQDSDSPCGTGDIDRAGIGLGHIAQGGAASCVGKAGATTDAKLLRPTALKSKPARKAKPASKTKAGCKTGTARAAVARSRAQAAPMAVGAEADVETVAARDLVDELAGLPVVHRASIVRQLTVSQRNELRDRWRHWAHDGQYPPEGDWRVWLIRAGRGFGKTRAGAEWVSQIARADPTARIALVGATIDDVRRVMIQGESGLIRVARDNEDLAWKGSVGELHFANGAKAYAYSAEAPESLRGPEHGWAWCDELAKWRYGDATWDNLMMGLRIGDAPRVLVTTTPRPIALMRRVMALPDLVETRGRTADNPHLSARFVAAMTASYAGTRLGRQELDGELIEDVAGALWTRGMLEERRVAFAPPVVRVVVGVDPPAGSVTGGAGDACGIVAVALGEDGFGYVLEDASVSGASPEGWARAVAECVERHGADRVIAEANQGGKMVGSVLAGADRAMPVRLVHASRGKSARAEPVAALYECGRAWHVGAFPDLEDELCGLIAGGGYEGPGRSPDRADALVWAMTELMLGPKRRVSVRVL